MLSMPLYLVLLCQGDAPTGWTFVAGTRLGAREGELLGLAWDRLAKTVKTPDAATVRDHIGYAFDETVWQADQMEVQTRLYGSILKLATARSAERTVTDFATKCLKFTGLEAPDPKFGLSVMREFTLRGWGSTVAFNLPGGAVRDLPATVIPSAGSEKAFGSWVKYPNQYSFVDKGEVVMRGKTAPIHVAAIDMIDDHIDAFMLKRAKARADIGVAVDGLDGPATEGKAVGELATELSARLVRGALDSGKGVSGAWARGATVERVTLRVFLDVNDSAGAVVRIEIP
jgi:hypothetical protein